MSDRVLQYVIADLRPLILPKLKAEADIQIRGSSSGKKSSVETHRGDSYQFCYFFRPIEPLSLVLKHRRYVATPAPPKREISATRAAGKRKVSSAKETSTRKRQRKDQGHNSGDAMDEDDPIEISESDDDMYAPNEDDSDDSMGGIPEFNQSAFNVDEEEEKPKPQLRLTYQGFNISGHCLCVVVEPWPPVKGGKGKVTGQVAALAEQSRLSVPPQPVRQSRGETPLFLPEEEENDVRALVDSPNLYAFDDDSDSDPSGDMMSFSQALNNAGDSRPGAVGDDDEMEGAVLFADADEIKEL
ncbi:hypothetical protein CC1G_00398 [Coprinopsis cinerea okayama7|uniref:Uncharacterized protein n=1 Tax=Coprinopsis cinerea (strain Okayama-7 / 130 / ATCC MYA-4618 / FGSC 9003) TaxID=240176 RepID=A8NXT5_COPC7|nr:hypothetical protein CC1G_00398 [Coprinopsis cinerea okayama7\|eukprot:XP_001837262.2 hypothetical protein CC1G_00398 [Coprinopsis cinerea okayama7\